MGVPVYNVGNSSVRIRSAMIYRGQGLRSRLVSLDFAVPACDVGFFLRIVGRKGSLFKDVFSKGVVSQTVVRRVTRRCRTFYLFFFVSVRRFSTMMYEAVSV